VVLSVSFGAEVFYCEALGVGFEREDFNADGGILLFEERDLFGFYWVIYSGHVESGLVFNIVGNAFFAKFRWVQRSKHGPQKTFRISVLYIQNTLLS